MTCSACHTRQITAEGKSYRIDGGPAIVDFQSFLTDLDAAVGQVLGSDAAFNSFAATVLLLATPDADDVAALRQDVNAWYLRFHTLMTRALPTPGWGPARLDAVGMIFNRLTGLDLGPPPSFLIADNIQKADAPVRYPFLWNAPIQDQTQWTGFADNGSDVLALSRNLGEVFGVFGVFEPKHDDWPDRRLPQQQFGELRRPRQARETWSSRSDRRNGHGSRSTRSRALARKDRRSSPGRRPMAAASNATALPPASCVSRCMADLGDADRQCRHRHPRP